MARLERAAPVLRVLAHPHRLRICELLMTGRVSVGQIAANLGIAANAVSQHLKMMKAYGLLGSHRVGKTVYYQVLDSRPAWLLTCIREHDREAGQEDDEAGDEGDVESGVDENVVVNDESGETENDDDMPTGAERDEGTSDRREECG